MPYSYITFHVPFTVKPRVPYHIEGCRTILSTSLSLHPDKSLAKHRILSITIYNEASLFTLRNSIGILREVTIFLNIVLCNHWSINYILNTPFMNFENEIKNAETTEDIIESLKIDVGELAFLDFYHNFDHYKNASTEFHVEAINVKKDLKKYLTIILSEDKKHQKLKDQILFFVLGANSDKLLLPLYNNVNIKYSLLNAVFEDLFLSQILNDSMGEKQKKLTFKKKLKIFINTLTTDSIRRELYFKTFEDIYLHRNLFTHTLKSETKQEQILTMQQNVPKFGYSLSDFIEGDMGRLGGEDMFTDLIRKHLIDRIKQIEI